MWRELIITDVTRMGGDKVCVAGVDRKGNVIRPVLPYPYTVREDDLYSDDSPLIRPRAVLNMFLEPNPECKPPHTEDHWWIDTNRVEFLRYANDATWKTVLERTASADVQKIFEAPIKGNKKIAPGDGSRSLGTIRPASIDKIGYYHLKFDEGESDKYTLNFTDYSSESFVQIPITDLALRYYLDYLREKGRLHPAKVRGMMEKKLAEAEVWLRLGLTRPYQKSDQDSKWCYLQITGIYTFPDYLEGRCFADFAPQKPSDLTA